MQFKCKYAYQIFHCFLNIIKHATIITAVMIITTVTGVTVDANTLSIDVLRPITESDLSIVVEVKQSQ